MNPPTFDSLCDDFWSISLLRLAWMLCPSWHRKGRNLWKFSISWNCFSSSLRFVAVFCNDDFSKEWRNGLKIAAFSAVKMTFEIHGWSESAVKLLPNEWTLNEDGDGSFRLLKAQLTKAAVLLISGEPFRQPQQANYTHHILRRFLNWKHSNWFFPSPTFAFHPSLAHIF